MAEKPNRQDSRGAMDLLEESAHALRTAGGGAIACYYVGALPFVLAALYFWADMSRSAFAGSHLMPATLALAALLVWMKCWQSVFMRLVLDRMCGQAGTQWTWRRALRMAAVQTAIQPWGLFIISLAALTVLPLPWAYAFFQNASLLGDGDESSTARATLGEAWRMARLWVGQNIVAMLVIVLLAAFVMLNLMQTILLPAWLLKTFLGEETIFSRGGFNTANTTFLAIVIALTYLCVDPFVKSFYTLRCFYGRSLRTGEDLQASLRQVLAARKPLAAMVAIIAAVLAIGASPASGRDVPAPAAPAPAGLVEHPQDAPPANMTPEQLDESINRVMSRSDYAWRMPHEKTEKDTSDSFLARLSRWLDDLRDEMRRRGENERQKDSGSSGGGRDRT